MEKDASAVEQFNKKQSLTNKIGKHSTGSENRDKVE